MRRTMKCLSPAVAALTILWVCPNWGSAGEDGTEKKPAVVVVRLPADAELVISGIKSKQTTPVREFDTPPLAPGKKFSYRIKAVWKDGDKEVKRETTIIVQAGETTDVNLREPLPSPLTVSEAAAPKSMPEMDRKPAAKSKSKSMPEMDRKPAAKSKSKSMPEMDMKPAPKPKSELMPEMDRKPAAKPKSVKKPEAKPEPEKKPQPKPEPEKKPEAKPEPEKKPQPKPSPSSSKPVLPPAQPKIVPEAPAAPKGTLALLMPETLTLQPGATKLLPIKVIRTHCEGAVSIKFEGLPPGVELKNAAVAADKQKVYLRAAASAEAEEKEWQVKVIGVSGSIRQDSALTIKIAK